MRKFLTTIKTKNKIRILFLFFFVLSLNLIILKEANAASVEIKGEENRLIIPGTTVNVDFDLTTSEQDWSNWANNPNGYQLKPVVDMYLSESQNRNIQQIQDVIDSFRIIGTKSDGTEITCEVNLTETSPFPKECSSDFLRYSNVGSTASHQLSFTTKANVTNNTTIVLKISIINKSNNSNVLHSSDEVIFNVNSQGYECGIIYNYVMNQSPRSGTLETGDVTCATAVNCLPPGTTTQCVDTCGSATRTTREFVQLPLTNSGCDGNKVCCVRKPLTITYGCETEYPDTKCQTVCSNPDCLLNSNNTANCYPFVLLARNATCPARNNEPQMCCSKQNYTTLHQSICIEPGDIYGIKLPIGSGCIPILHNLQEAVIYILIWSSGIAGLISMFFISYSGFLIINSKGDSTKVQAGKELLSATITGLVFLTFSIFLLRVIAADILKIIK
ncbi:MAG: pilin [Patescibacteria group bacterium]|nr:pilin [Patescibacteria group bacterium]